MNTAGRTTDLLGGIGSIILGLAATTLPAIADVTLTDSTNLVLITQDSGTSDMTSAPVRPEVTGGHGGTLVPYTASGPSFWPAPFDAANLNNGDVGADNISSLDYALMGFAGGAQNVDMAFAAGIVKIKGIAIYGGYSLALNRALLTDVAGTYTLTDGAGVVLGEWSDDGMHDFGGSSGPTPAVSDYWLNFPVRVSTSGLHLRFQPHPADDTHGAGAHNSYREIQVFSMTPAEQIEGVIAAVDVIDPLNAGIRNSLLASLGGALDKLDPPAGVDIAAARAKLNAFINKVMAQSGKALTREEADSLVAMARAILAQL
jgi:hypothetical protein